MLNTLIHKLLWCQKKSETKTSPYLISKRLSVNYKTTVSASFNIILSITCKNICLDTFLRILINNSV